MTIPRYVLDSGVSKQPIAFAWSPYKGVTLVERFPERIAEIVRRLSLRANFSLAIGIGEWLAWRLDAHSNYPQLAQYIEALWARSVDKAYLRINSLDTPSDTGDRVQGALTAMEDALYTAFRKATQNHPERGAATAGLVSLVRYTLIEAKQFDEWLKATLSRFQEQFSLDPNNRVGSLVPRAFLDPSVKIENAAAAEYLDAQLREIDPVGNPFLNSPEQARAAGLSGEPYRFLP
jgi:hypothetical protein